MVTRVSVTPAIYCRSGTTIPRTPGSRVTAPLLLEDQEHLEEREPVMHQISGLMWSQRQQVENVHALCTGEEGFGYKGYNVSPRYPKIHVPGWGFTNHNGTAGKSIYGEKLPDGNFQLKHGGIGPNTNGSQFFICTASTEWLNGNHVVFGSVVDGLDVLKAIEEHGTKSGTPKAKVAIADCGELKYC
ncbi:peptidyl-prolyl cis-trans isomerase isoform X2 [Scophthalmus maximus]|nr:peptidyl-prolyl cis-trans isomerase isoform X2 [Scophthalmus maximus]